jgi:hypothetical protein
MTREEDQAATDAAVAAFLAAGGKIQEVPWGKSGRVEGQSYSAWGRPGPKKKADAAPMPGLDSEEE